MHYTIAAELGDRHAQLALAYRYMYGIDVDRSCNESFVHSERAARASFLASGGSFYGRAPTYSKISLARLDRHPARQLGGVRALTRPTRQLLKNEPRALSDHSALMNHLDITWYNAKRGNLRAQLELAVTLYEGSALGPAHRLGAVRRDIERSYELAKGLVSRVYTIDMPASLKAQRKDPEALVVVQSTDDEAAVLNAGFAAELIGTMIMRQEIPVPHKEASVYLALAIRACADWCPKARAKHVHLVSRTPNPARKRNDVMALLPMDVADLAVEAAFISMEIGKLTEAGVFLDMAPAKNDRAVKSRLMDNVITAKYVRGMYYSAASQFTPAVCMEATSNLHQVALMGDWEDPVYHRAEAALAHGDERTALLAFAISAESGEAAAQESIAHMNDPYRTLLDEDIVGLHAHARGAAYHGAAPILRASSRADVNMSIAYWSRAALLGSGTALVRLGDYFAHGFGVKGDMNAAMALYGSVAPESLEYPEALFALGGIYESGNGTSRADLGMAKRCFDTALLMSRGRASVAVFLANARLHLRALYGFFCGDQASRKLFVSYVTQIGQILGQGTSIYEEPDGSRAPAGAAPPAQSTSVFKIRVMGMDFVLIVVSALALVALYAARRRVVRDLHNAEAQLQEARAVR